MRCHFVVEALFDVEALGHGFNHQIAIGKLGQTVVVVGSADVADGIFAGQGGGLLFFQRGNGFFDDAVFRAFFGRQVKQHHRHFGVGQMGGNLCTHHAGAEHGGFADDEVFCGHGNPLSFVAFGFQTASLFFKRPSETSGGVKTYKCIAGREYWRCS